MVFRTIIDYKGTNLLRNTETTIRKFAVNSA